MIQDHEEEYQKLQSIEKMKGRHTSLVTYLVSKDTNL